MRFSKQFDFCNPVRDKALSVIDLWWIALQQWLTKPWLLLSTRTVGFSVAGLCSLSTSISVSPDAKCSLSQLPITVQSSQPKSFDLTRGEGPGVALVYLTSLLRVNMDRPKQNSFLFFYFVFLLTIPFPFFLKNIEKTNSQKMKPVGH